MDHRQEAEIQSQAFKFYLLTALTGALFFVLLLRLASLQIYQGERLKSFSDSNRLKRQLLPAPRGLIVDRHGQILAGNKKTAQLILHPGSPRSLKAGLEKISQIIQIPLEKIEEGIEKRQKRDGPFYPVILKKDLSLMEIHKLKQALWDYPEIQVMEIEKRVYPLSESGSQALGFIGSISKREIRKFKRQKRAFHWGDLVGKSGLEKKYDQRLKGQNGWLLLETDAQNRLSGRDISQPFDFLKIHPVKGKDLALTIDKNLQRLALKAMLRADAIGPRSGAVIVMRANGEILAALSEPGFDPNILSSNIDSALWEKWSAKESKVFINKALQEHYSPGSLFKPFVALAALEEGVITDKTKLHSGAAFKVGKRVFHDHSPLGHGDINVVTALEKSANTFFYQVADQLGIEKIYRYARLFGFGRKTQIDIAGERAGLLPHPSWRKRRFNEKWRRGDTINISIGQGDLLATLLQLAVAYNAIATQGLVVRPFLARLNKPVILDSLTDRIKREHFMTVKEGLRLVVEGGQGTARRHRLDFVSFSGKTGTAQVISLAGDKIYQKCRLMRKRRRHHGWFVGFAPSRQPEIVVAVFTEHSCSGSGGSAPVARDIMRYYFKNRRL